MAYQMLTRTGKSFWETTSAMQNAIRKGDFEVAGYAMWELLPRYASYLRKRLLVISAEDCFGVITKEIWTLTEREDEEGFCKALTLLCTAKKNRDADYFVCNLMYSDVPGAWEKGELARKLHTAIRKRDMLAAGRYSAELFKSNRKDFWRMLRETVQVFYPHLEDEIDALQISNDKMTKPAEETIFVAKAIVLMWTERCPIDLMLGHPAMDFFGLLDPANIVPPKPLDECAKIPGLFPDWAYNWHTSYGKYTLHRDAVHAITNDQELLTPLEENLFDDCSWNRDINICLKQHNPKRRPLPFDDGKRTVEEKYGAEK